MTQVIAIERKSAVLTPSSLACLAHVPTVNLTAGCAHECRYCYARGYLTHPGEGKIRFYTNTLDKLREELRRKRKKPTTVYFSPSSDPFQPVPEVLNMAYDVFRFLLESEIGVAFVTKGLIPERHRKLLAAHAPLVQGRIGLITLDPGTTAALEPGAATPEVRLAQAAELIGAGVPVEARLDPILPGVTDGADCLHPLCAALARIGVRRIAASVLFLRPAVIGSLRRHVKDQVMLKRAAACERFRPGRVLRSWNVSNPSHTATAWRSSSVPARTRTSPVAPATFRAAGRLRPRRALCTEEGCRL
jgi:DNA repair photolyase